MGQLSRQTGQPATFPYTATDSLLQDFVSRGLVVLSPDSLGIPRELHEQIYEQEKTAFRAKRHITTSVIPDVLEVLSAPGLVAAVNQLLGESWAIVPFTHNTPFVSGSHDQHWHKDDNGPYNSRKQRHHQAVQMELLYYPQAVAEDMGPTATIPYSQYWTFNHEENHDNFAGADHLDFDYQLIGMERVPVSGRHSQYDPADIVKRNTAHDIRMRKAVEKTGWPLVKAFEAAPLEAGSVVLYSHNLFHRGNHRRDDWQNWKPNPRFMWRFWLYRTTDPIAQGEIAAPDWQRFECDRLTSVDLSDLTEDAAAVWCHQYHWSRTGQPPLPISADQDTARQLAAQLLLKGEAAEPQRIGAAYRLAALADQPLALQTLTEALYEDRESVRRAATFGLIAAGRCATDTLLEASRSNRKWVRKAGVHGLGDAADLTPEVLAAVTTRLEQDPSVYVRSVAADALGSLARRAIAGNSGIELLPACARALVASLAREENRLGMDKAQGRSIKFVRPTDESDVCEGIGVDYGVDRYQPVRSAVRESALRSLVILCSHGARCLGDALSETSTALAEVVRADDNVFSVGLAMDAMNRLLFLREEDANNTALEPLRRSIADLFATSPILDQESLLRGGRRWTTSD